MPPPAVASVTASVKGLLGAVAHLLGSVRDAVASAPVRLGASEVVQSGRSVAKTTGAKGAKLKKSLKGYWANLKGKARADRIRKMLAGRGLEPKVKKPPTARGKALKKALKALWARMTPEQRAERVKKMLAGRGLKPKAKPAA